MAHKRTPKLESIHSVSLLWLAIALNSIILGSASAQVQTFTVMFSFDGSDGANPYASLCMDSAGNIYGTTQGGGQYGYGTVFKLDTSGNETVLYSFTGGTDGRFPQAGLVLDKAGTLYGTTAAGGANGDGTVFKVDTSGYETVLHNFGPQGNGDGRYPSFGSLVVDTTGSLYGTTAVGGASEEGTVFKVDGSGNETVLYSFSGGADGLNPYGGLIMDAPGNLYGTTAGGGAKQCSNSIPPATRPYCIASQESTEEIPLQV